MNEEGRCSDAAAFFIGDSRSQGWRQELRMPRSARPNAERNTMRRKTNTASIAVNTK